MELFYGEDKTFDTIMKEKKNFVFIGEAGSGKSEVVLNVAAMLAEKTGKMVDLFDLDQTKPLYRSRDLQAIFRDKGVDINYQDQYLDAPTIVGGVATSLQREGYTLLDIGGGHSAARMAGAYSHILSKDDSIPVYIMNPYRPWTRSIEGIDGTMSHILRSIRLNQIYLLGNPNVGYTTTLNEFMEGLDKLNTTLEGVATYSSACVRRGIYEEAKSKTDKFLIPLDLYLTYSWVD